MSAVDLRAAIRAKFEKELTGYEKLLAKADELFDRNQAKAFLDTTRPSTGAVLGLYTKARKGVAALHVLATSGYGEDAMIIARSLVNLCIDLGYICRTDSDDRARQWIARGRVSRREMAQAFGLTPPDEVTVDWGKVGERARAWKAVRIFDRAKDAGLENFYEIAYRHGCVYEHSDAWGALAYLDIVDDSIDMRSEPSPTRVDTALLAGAFAFGEIASISGKYWGFDIAQADREIFDLVMTAFRKSDASS